MSIPKSLSFKKLLFKFIKIKSYQSVLKANCPAKSGIVAAVTGYLAEKGCYLSELHQFDDSVTGQFFMRADCSIESDSETIESVSEGFR